MKPNNFNTDQVQYLYFKNEDQAHASIVGGQAIKSNSVKHTYQTIVKNGKTINTIFMPMLYTEADYAQTQEVVSGEECPLSANTDYYVYLLDSNQTSLTVIYSNLKNSHYKKRQLGSIGYQYTIHSRIDNQPVIAYIFRDFIKTAVFGTDSGTSGHLEVSLTVVLYYENGERVQFSDEEVAMLSISGLKSTLSPHLPKIGLYDYISGFTGKTLQARDSTFQWHTNQRYYSGTANSIKKDYSKSIFNIEHEGQTSFVGRIRVGDYFSIRYGVIDSLSSVVPSVLWIFLSSDIPILDRSDTQKSLNDHLYEQVDGVAYSTTRLELNDGLNYNLTFIDKNDEQTIMAKSYIDINEQNMSRFSQSLSTDSNDVFVSSSIEVGVGEQISLEELLRKVKLPVEASLEVAELPDTTVVGKRNAIFYMVYPTGQKDIIAIPISVVDQFKIHTHVEKYPLNVLGEVRVKRGGMLHKKNILEQLAISNLPADARIEVAGMPTTDYPGIFTATIRVYYGDGTRADVSVPIRIEDVINDIFSREQGGEPNSSITVGTYSYSDRKMDEKTGINQAFAIFLGGTVLSIQQDEGDLSSSTSNMRKYKKFNNQVE